MPEQRRIPSPAELAPSALLDGQRVKGDADETCPYMVPEPPHYFHWHRCGRRGRFTITLHGGVTKKVCGIHKRVHDRHLTMKGNYA